MASPKRARSAGGLVLNRTDRLILVRQQFGTWSLPKGTLEPGETLLEAARREIAEESGVTKLTFIKKFGSYTRYRIALDRKADRSHKKTLTFFLFTTTQSRLRPRAPANPEARWPVPGSRTRRVPAAGNT